METITVKGLCEGPLPLCPSQHTYPTAHHAQCYRSFASNSLKNSGSRLKKKKKKTQVTVNSSFLSEVQAACKSACPSQGECHQASICLTFVFFCLSPYKLCTSHFFLLNFQMKSAFWVNTAHLVMVKRKGKFHCNRKGKQKLHKSP